MYDGAPSPPFLKVAFWQPKIIKWSPDIKYFLCNTTERFERIKMAAEQSQSILGKGTRDNSRLNTHRTRAKLGKLQRKQSINDI